jgi:hypothetical protein
MVGISIRTCRNENKHVLALEGNKEIFDNLLKPLTYDCPNEANKGFNDKDNDQDHMFDDDDDIGLIIY